VSVFLKTPIEIIKTKTKIIKKKHSKKSSENFEIKKNPFRRNNNIIMPHNEITISEE